MGMGESVRVEEEEEKEEYLDVAWSPPSLVDYVRAVSSPVVL